MKIFTCKNFYITSFELFYYVKRKAKRCLEDKDASLKLQLNFFLSIQNEI